MQVKQERLKIQQQPKLNRTIIIKQPRIQQQPSPSRTVVTVELLPECPNANQPAGLYLAGNDTISAGRGGVGPTFSDREAAAGLTNTMSGRVAMNATNPDFPTVGTPSGNDLFESVMVNAGGGGGGGGLAGLEIIWSDESTTFITASQAYSGYGGSGYWSLVLPIVSSAFTKVYSFDAGTTISSSSEYRLRLYTPYTNSSGDTAVTKISALGQYRAMIICVNGAGRAVLIKVG
jgi:hypothetical protein